MASGKNVTVKDAPTDVEVVRPGQAQLPDHLRNLVQEDMGLGTSQAVEDNIVPLIYVLQTNSPQVDKRNKEAYIEGASAGDFYLKGSIDPIAPGDGGMICIPCAFDKGIVEWVPRDKGGGYVTQHRDWPDDTEEYKDPKDPNKTLFRRPNGNDLVETRYHYVLVNGQMYCMPFSASGHTDSRNWMNFMNQFKSGGKVLPSFHRRYLLTTIAKSNTKGSWFGVKAEPLGCVETEEEYMEARALAVAVSKGEKVADAQDLGTQQGPVPGADTSSAAQHI